MTPSSAASGGYRMVVLAIVGGGLCALFLGLLGGIQPSSRESGPGGPGGGEVEVPKPEAGPRRLQGMEAIRVVARTVREIRVQTQDEATASAMARQYLDRVLPQDEPTRRILLIEALGDADDDVRWVALTGVFRYGSVDARLGKILIARGRDEAPFVRKAALAAIRGTRRADREAVLLLQQNLPTAQGALWSAILHALVNIEADVAYKPLLLSALADTSVEKRRAAAYGLARIDMSPGETALQHADALAPMIEALDDPDSDVRMWIAQALSRMEHEAAPAVGALVEHLVDPAPHVADWAKAALGEIGVPALPAVERVVREGDRKRASGAMYVLRRVGGAKSAAILREGLRHTDPVIRVRSIMALRDLRLMKLDAIPLYVAVLQLDDTEARLLALEGLSRLGADAYPARDAVARLEDDADEATRLKARSILTAIGQRKGD